MTDRPRRTHTGGTLKGRGTMNKRKVGDIKILSERNVRYVELDLDMDDDTLDKLAQAGWETIQKDKHALANYAFVKALEEFVHANGNR